MRISKKSGQFPAVEVTSSGTCYMLVLDEERRCTAEQVWNGEVFPTLAVSYHTPIALSLDENTVLVNSSKYSVTSSRHLGQVLGGFIRNGARRDGFSAFIKNKNVKLLPEKEFMKEVAKVFVYDRFEMPSISEAHLSRIKEARFKRLADLMKGGS